MTKTTDVLQEFQIRGLDCAEEVAVLKRELGPLVGMESRLAFHILDGTMTVLPGEPFVTSLQIVEAVARTGMKATPVAGGTTAIVSETRLGKFVLPTISGVAIGLGMIAHGAMTGWGAMLEATSGVPMFSKSFYLLAIVAGVWAVLPKAWFALKRYRPDMNLLMVVAVVGALIIGEWLEGATVAFLFAVSLALESWSIGRARRAVAALMELTPTKVRVKDPSGERELPPEAVAVGTVFFVRPGDKIPLDGTISTGRSTVDQASITGESVPVEKDPGDTVFAGTVNGDGLLEVTSTKRADDTTLARIVRMVRDAQNKRGPSEQWVERFARIYTPAVMILAMIVALAVPLVLSQPFAPWLYQSLVLLVIACPCALVISTPVSIVASLASAARNGVLIKGGMFVEAPATLRCIAFDKTGTLTRGKPEVRDIIPLAGESEDRVLSLAAALEERSNHPLARAIVDAARSRGLKWIPVSELQTAQGRGVTAMQDGHAFWLGSHRWLDEKKLESASLHTQLEEYAAEGKTVVVVGRDDELLGIITLADAVKPETQAILADLKALGVERLVMLTGDNKGSAKRLADAIGLDDYTAEMLPENKVQKIEALVREFGFVAMIGDGVNDAPALARATIGIAMGAAGSDAAIETADIALMTDDLRKLPWLIRHSRRTLRTIRQNIAFSLAVKLCFVVATFAGFASMWAAIAADTGASLIVIANGLRLLRR